MDIHYIQEGLDFIRQFFLSPEYSKAGKDMFAKLFLKKSIVRFNININKQFFSESIETCLAWLSNKDMIDFNAKINFLYDTLISRAIANHNGRITYKNIDELTHNEEFINNIQDMISIGELFTV